MSKLSWRSPKLNVRTLTLSALLVALEVVLSKISIGDPNLFKISLEFIGTALIGYMAGPWLGGALMVVNDLIGNTVFNSGNIFFPGFTFSAMISGIIAGMFLYQQKITWQRIFLYEFIQIGISNVFFNTLWIYLLNMTSSHHMSWMALLIARLPKEIITWPIEALTLIVVLKAVERILKNVARR